MLSDMEKLTPSLKLKTSELYFRWFSDPDKSESLKELIQLIKSGRALRLNDLQNSFKDSKMVRPRSPTIQSPPMSPISRMPNSPKSPRRKFANKVIAQAAAKQQASVFSEMVSKTYHLYLFWSEIRLFENIYEKKNS